MILFCNVQRTKLFVDSGVNLGGNDGLFSTGGKNGALQTNMTKFIRNIIGLRYYTEKNKLKVRTQYDEPDLNKCQKSGPKTPIASKVIP